MNSQPSLVCGVFIARLGIDRWKLKTDAGEIDLVYFGAYLPILHTVKYTVECVPEARIIDGDRLPWSKEIQERYFPTCTFTPVFDPSKCCQLQVVKSVDCIRWLKFDLDFKIQALVPTIPFIRYATMLRIQQLEGLKKLVYCVGGVQPLVLRRFRPPVPDEMIVDAHNLQVITNIMKERIRVWLSETDCSQFLVDDPTTKASIKRLISLGTVTKREFAKNDVRLALTWAVTKSDRFPACNATHIARAQPKLVTEVNDQLVGDVNMGVDEWIDRKQVVVTMLHQVTWLNVTRDPLENLIVHCTSTEALILHVKAQLAQHNPQTVVTFSPEGIFEFDSKGARTCFCKSTQSVVQVRVNGADAATLLVNQQPLSKERVYEDLVAASTFPWSEISSLGNYQPQAVVGILQSRFDLRWIPWLHQFTGTKILVATFVKQTHAG